MPAYNKLVRDRIPEIIRESGKDCTVEVLSETEICSQLEIKLQEEIEEYWESGSIAELADVVEVIHAIARVKGSTVEELERLRLAKLAERGGFEKRLFLKSVED